VLGFSSRETDRETDRETEREREREREREKGESAGLRSQTAYCGTRATRGPLLDAPSSKGPLRAEGGWKRPGGRHGNTTLGNRGTTGDAVQPPRTIPEGVMPSCWRAA